MIGKFATSKAGHDKTKLYIIIKEDAEYVYLVDGNTLVLRNSPRQDMSDVTKEYGMLNANHQGKWGNEKSQIEYMGRGPRPIYPQPMRLFA